MKQVYRLFSSKTFALYVFGALIVLLIPRSLLSGKLPALDTSIRFILVLICLNLIVCAIRRFKSLSRPVLFIHIGCIVTLAGVLISTLGYISTVNIHEGSSTDIAFRWNVEKDVPLGFGLAVNGIHRNYYPINVKVGVLKEDKKHDLFSIKTGESFELENYRVMADRLELTSQNLTLQVYGEDDRLVGAYSTGGGNSLPEDFPYSFKLVAFQEPMLKRVCTDISILQDNKVIANGVAEVNHPFIWNGLRFYNTSTGIDPAGRFYAGIQIVRDPGILYVYAGFSIICLGALFDLKRLFRKKRLPKTQPGKITS
jgi:hypothetical protein